MHLGPAGEHAVLDQLPRNDVAWLGPYPDADATGRHDAFSIAVLTVCDDRIAEITSFIGADFTPFGLPEAMV
jgi:hypothetical protein